MLVQILYLLAALFLSSVVHADGDSAWHLDNIWSLVNEELDPIVSPNAQSSHMHAIVGGSRMAAYYNYDDYAAAKCSSLEVQADKSNYWMPQLYVIDHDLSKFVPVSAKIRFYYFLAKNSDNDPVSAFPKGLRLLVGNPNNKAVTSVASFTCQINSDFSDSVVANDFNFDRDCPYGMKTELYFPPCWDGYNLYASDGSHMSYPSNGVRDGMCPWSHPIRLPAIQLEYTWYTSNYNPGTALSGNLAWANGDTTGYGVHGDFINGWDLDVLNAALNDTSCNNIGKSITMSDCPTLYKYFDATAAAACTPEKGTLTEPTGNVDNVAIDALPGCNPLWSNGTKPTCSPAVAGLDVSAFTGTDGSLIAATEDQKKFVWPTTPGFKKIACLHDISSVVGGTSYTDSYLTVESCTAHCLASGYQFAGTGQEGTGWNCVCGTGISSSALVEPGMCTTACPGNSTENCGGSYIFNIWYAPNGTVADIGKDRDDGSKYLGCYNDPSTVSDGLLGKATYSFSSNSMTTEVCIEACAQQGTSWAATLSAKNCYCGNEYYYGTGALMPTRYCTVACAGNSSEYCGDYYKASLYNITSVEVTNSSAGYMTGYQGCYQDKSGHLALTNNSWTSTAMTAAQCVNGCSELGYSYAGVEGGNTCYCGSKVSSTVTVLPASQCQTACTGNSTATCGGTQALDLYTVEGAVNTTASLAAARPTGYLGCFKDMGSNLAFSNYYTYTFKSMTVEICKAACVELGYSYAGVENANQCNCGNNYPQTSQMVSGLYCTKSCAGNSSETCGAGGYLEAYTLSNSSSSSTSVMAGTSSSAYVGCYDNSNRGLAAYSYADSGMTVEVCRTTCAEFGYSLSGVYLARYCGCGNSWTGATQKYPSSSCQNYACSGNSTEWCGGLTQLAMYNTTGVSTSVKKPTGWLSCWTDSSSSRSLTSYSYSASPMSAKACRTACNQQGYAYAGTENGNQCYCGNTLAGEKAPTSQCKTTCTGTTANETCGASGYMDLYNATGASSDNGISGYLGCYTDDTKLTGNSFVSDYMSVEVCAQWCLARGTTYAGVRNGNQCKCGNTSPSLVTTLAACNTSCTATGATSEPCGSSSAIGVYTIADTTVTSGEFPITTNSSGYAGCYKEGSTRMLPSYSFSSNSMTNDLCRSSCKTLGYAYAGSQYATQCYCANSLNATAGGYKIQESNCATDCKGGVGKCGAGGVLSLWTTSGLNSSTATVEGLQGCYAIGSFLQSPGLTYSGDYMTTDLCRRTCRFGGWSIAGLTNGNGCYCSSTANYGSQVAPAVCNAACKGQSNQTCGATSSGAFSIFDTTGAGAQPPSGYPDDYVGCISDGSPRKLSDYSFKNGGMTSAMVRKLAIAGGYPSYGTESSNEGYMGYSKLSPPLLPDTYCTSMCPGAPTERCGGGGRLSYYYMASVSNTTDTSTSAAATFTSVSANATSTSPVSTTVNVSVSTSASSSASSSRVSSNAGSSSVGTTSAPSSSSNSTSTGYFSAVSTSAIVSTGTPSTSSMPSVSANYSVSTVPAQSTTTSTPVGPSVFASSSSISTIAPALSTSPVANMSSATSSRSSSAVSSSVSANASTSAFSSIVASSSAPFSSASPTNTSSAVSATAASSSASTQAPSSAPSSSSSSTVYSTVYSTVTVSIGTSSSTPSSTSSSTAPSATGTSLGCYTGSSSSFANSKMTSHENLTPSMCQIWCNANYYTYAGLSGGNSCGCASDLSGLTNATASSCSTSCSGDSSQSCGGTADSVYSIYQAVAATKSTKRSGSVEPAKRRTAVHGRRVVNRMPNRA
ncbi:hypothetical protein I350_01707 [Cryptococcus amylolentus CBS 6273]|uniref:WSC domain-containing protein n=1 Tax=Cryptococcus amylolentus CBS 6273 TaxID=1296118 RepID=A0A1E3KDL9_9TREE|nr:hypothetical protein I350_01707 [Cryptococcus amylolentus CBS 6273]